MELPLTHQRKQYTIVFQDLFTKWPMVYTTSDQKVTRIATKLLAEETMVMFGLPEALLSDQVTKALSCLMQDVCRN